MPHVSFLMFTSRRSCRHTRVIICVWQRHGERHGAETVLDKERVPDREVLDGRVPNREVLDGRVPDREVLDRGCQTGGGGGGGGRLDMGRGGCQTGRCWTGGARQGGVGQGVPDWEVLDRGARLGGAGQGTGNGGFVSWSLLYSSALEPTDWAVAACDLE